MNHADLDVHICTLFSSCHYSRRARRYMISTLHIVLIWKLEIIVYIVPENKPKETNNNSSLLPRRKRTWKCQVHNISWSEQPQAFDRTWPVTAQKKKRNCKSEMQKSMVCERFTCAQPHHEQSSDFSRLIRISHAWKPILQQTEFEYRLWFGYSRAKQSIHGKFHGRNFSQQVIHRKVLVCFQHFKRSESFSFTTLFCMLTEEQPNTAATSHHQKICDTNFAEPAISNIKPMRNDVDLCSENDD